ncbi:MAG: hypothetical protein JO287_19320 [Pseudonocardiales bacterium]|nr:hypothetical protein [Pseudonocardiales bacterium]
MKTDLRGHCDTRLAPDVASGSVVDVKIIFFTTYVTVIRRDQEGMQKRWGSPARVEGNTIRLPIGTDVEADDYLEYRLANDELQMLRVIDVIHPHMPGASDTADHIEVTCVTSKRAAIPRVEAPRLHPAMSVALALMDNGQISEAVYEALRLVQERVRSLAASDDSGRTLMESVFDASQPQLDVTTTTGASAEDEQEGFRLLFIGATLGLGSLHGSGRGAPSTSEEAFEYLAVASMLMRRLDYAESRLG